MSSSLFHWLTRRIENRAVAKNQEEKNQTRMAQGTCCLRAVDQTLVEQLGWQQNSYAAKNLLGTNQ